MTRVVTVKEPAPPETTVVTETTGMVEANVEPRSPCGGIPAETLALQYQLINAGDYEGAYALFAERSKQVISPEQYRTFFEANAPYSVTDYSFPSVDIHGDAATVQALFTVTSSTGQEFLERTQELVCEGSAWLVIMREEQAAAFAEAASEPQYEAPDGPDPDVPNPNVSEYAPKPDSPPSGDIDCSTYSGPPIPVPPGSDGDGDSDGFACE